MNKEIKLSKNTMIVSETNSKVHIIYANSDVGKFLVLRKKN